MPITRSRTTSFCVKWRSSCGGPGANSSVYIRGANSGHTLLLIDGVRVGSATNGAPTLETIPLELIDRVEKAERERAEREALEWAAAEVVADDDLSKGDD